MKIMHDDKKINAMQDQGAENATDISELQEAVGDEDSGLIKAVADLQTEKATLSDVETLLASGDVATIKAETLEQTEANLTITASPTLPSGVEYQTGKVPYTAIKVINGILWLVCVLSITNSGESAYSGSLTLFPSVSIPTEIAGKIYRVDGTTCNQAYTAGVSLICDAPVMQGNTARRAVIGSYGANTINLYIDSFSLNAGANVDLSIRVPIVLL